MPILPPQCGAVAAPAQCNADFERQTHRERRHSGAWNAETRSELPLFPSKTRAMYNPGYPPPPRVRRIDHTVVEPPAAHGKKTYPGLMNSESFREEFLSLPPAGIPVHIMRVMRVLDPATGHPVKYRRGIEADLSSRDPGYGLGHLHRVNYDVQAHNEGVIINKLRQGLGYSKPHDVLYDEALFYSSKQVFQPGKYYPPPHERTHPTPLMRSSTAGGAGTSTAGLSVRGRAATAAGGSRLGPNGQGVGVGVSAAAADGGKDSGPSYALPSRPATAAPVSAGKLAHSSNTVGKVGVLGLTSGLGATSSNTTSSSSSSRPSTAMAYLARTGGGTGGGLQGTTAAGPSAHAGASAAHSSRAATALPGKRR